MQRQFHLAKPGALPVPCDQGCKLLSWHDISSRLGQKAAVFLSQPEGRGTVALSAVIRVTKGNKFSAKTALNCHLGFREGIACK